jgi:hypothetical protein
MTLIKSNVAWVQGAKQTAKGTPYVTPKWRTRVSSDDRLAPRAETATFPETDSSRDAPNSEKMQGGTEGSFAFGVRDSIFHWFAELALGDKVTSGATNFTHTSVGSNTLPYFGAEQMLGDTLWERYDDLVANELTVSVEAGGFMTASLSAMGITVVRQTAVPGTLATLASGPLYTFNEATVSLGGSAVGYVRSMNLTLSNNIQLLQTDDIAPRDIHVGMREVTLGFDMLFEDLTQYNLFHYGSTVGTAQSATTSTTDLLFSFSKGVNNSIDFDFDSVNYEEYPIGPDPGGEPIIVSARVRARRSGTQLLKIVTKNQDAGT